MSIAEQTQAALRHVAGLIDDKRKILIIGAPHVIAELRTTGEALWKPVPACFTPRPGGFGELVVGSFDGVPVAEFEDSPTEGLGFVFDGIAFAGVTRFPETGDFSSWHQVDGKMITHPEKFRIGALQ